MDKTTVDAMLFLLWIGFNVYLIKNHRAVARLYRGYSAYDAWKAKDWVRQWNDFELSDIEQTCFVFRMKGGKNGNCHR